MSDEQGNTGWWLASDGRWYPPEQHADYVGASATAEAPTTSQSTPPPFPGPPPSDQPPPRSGWSRTWPWLAVSAAGLIMLSTLAGLAAGPDVVSTDADIQEVRSREMTTTTERIASTTADYRTPASHDGRCTASTPACPCRCSSA